MGIESYLPLFYVKVRPKAVGLLLVKCYGFIFSRYSAIMDVTIQLGDDCMLSNIGFPGLILILVLALIIFGPQKLPEIGRAFGNSLREFKKATEGLTDDLKKEMKDDDKDAKK